MANDFRSYLGIMRAYWLSAMSGAFSVPFTIAGVLAGEKYQQIIFGLLAIASFWFAAFGVWKKERDKAIALNSRVDGLSDELNKLRQPKLIGVIEQTIGGQLRPMFGGAVRTSVLCNLSIKNLGAPSVVDKFQIWVERNGQRYRCQLQTIPENVPFQFDDGNPPIQFTRADAIYEKGTAPILSGAQIRGWILGTLAELSNLELMSPGTNIIVSFEDVTGARVSAEHSLSDDNKGLQYFPDGSGGLNLSKSSS